MRKRVKNQVTGKFRQIVHCPPTYGGDRWSFADKPIRCSRNDSYEFDQSGGNKKTYLCPKCLLAARRSKASFHTPVCPRCRQEMQACGMRWRLPKKRKLKKTLK